MIRMLGGCAENDGRGGGSVQSRGVDVEAGISEFVGREELEGLRGKKRLTRSILTSVYGKVSDDRSKLPVNMHYIIIIN